MKKKLFALTALVGTPERNQSPPTTEKSCFLKITKKREFTRKFCRYLTNIFIYVT